MYWVGWNRHPQKLFIMCKCNTFEKNWLNVVQWIGCSQMKVKVFPLLVALFATTALWAYDFKSGDLCYSITGDNTVEVIRDYDNYDLTSVNIPSFVIDESTGRTYSVTSIGVHAFAGYSGLTSVTIGNSVTSIGYGAFDSCTGLASATIGNSVTSIGDFAFSDCTGLTSIAIPNSVTSIGSSAFSDCISLTSITIPNSVTRMEWGAFYGCTGLTSITIPNSVTSIGGAFIGCTGLASIIVESDNTTYDSRDNCNAIIETATNTLVQGCNTTIIPNSVTSIGEEAFSYCTSLTSITIPNSVTSIGESVFSGCTGLTSVTIPNSVTSIGWWAFGECTNLTSVVIGNNNELNIEADAFSYCENLTSVTCYANVPPIIIFDEYEGEKDGAFDAERLSKMRLYVPAEAISRYKEAEEWKDFGRIASIGATTIDTDDEQLVVQPTFTDVTITWKIVPNAETYTIAITRGTETVCTLTFNADGQLTNIAFAAPSRNGTPRHAPAAVMTEQGYRFTVTGLESGTQYGYTLSVKDSNGKELQTYTGAFTTQGVGTAIGNPSADNTTTQPKVIHNGQMYIRRGDKTYTVTGMEVK